MSPGGSLSLASRRKNLDRKSWCSSLGEDESGSRRSHLRPPPFNITPLEKRLCLIFVEGNCERELAPSRSMQPTVLAAKLERSKQSHIVFHVRKFACS